LLVADAERAVIAVAWAWVGAGKVTLRVARVRIHDDKATIVAE
jgi:hypothetical protein